MTRKKKGVDKTPKRRALTPEEQRHEWEACRLALNYLMRAASIIDSEIQSLTPEIRRDLKKIIAEGRRLYPEGIPPSDESPGQKGPSKRRKGRG